MTVKDDGDLVATRIGRHCGGGAENVTHGDLLGAGVSAGRDVATAFSASHRAALESQALRRPRARRFGGMTVHSTVIWFRLTLRLATSALSGGVPTRPAFGEWA